MQWLKNILNSNWTKPSHYLASLTDECYYGDEAIKLAGPTVRIFYLYALSSSILLIFKHFLISRDTKAMI